MSFSSQGRQDTYSRDDPAGWSAWYDWFVTKDEIVPTMRVLPKLRHSDHRPIEADFDGTVTAVHATEGQAIAEGDPILDIEED